jgi:hypothetical protein
MILLSVRECAIPDKQKQGCFCLSLFAFQSIIGILVRSLLLAHDSLVTLTHIK